MLAFDPDVLFDLLAMEESEFMMDCIILPLIEPELDPELPSLLAELGKLKMLETDCSCEIGLIFVASAAIFIKSSKSIV